MEQLKILTDLVADRQRIYLSYNRNSSTWGLRTIFDGQFQSIPYSLRDFLNNNQSLDFDVKINVTACPASSFCAYLSGQLRDWDDIFDSTGFELRFDGVVVAPVGENIIHQGPAHLIAHMNPDLETPSVEFDCYWLNSEGWVKINDSDPIIRGELRLTKHNLDYSR